MLDVAGLRNRHHARLPQHPGQRHLRGRGAKARGDRREAPCAQRAAPVRAASTPSRECRACCTTAAGRVRCRGASGCRAPGWSRPACRPAPSSAASSSMSSTSKLLTPQWRILPSRSSVLNASSVSSSGTRPRQCSRYRSSRSVFSRRRLASHAAMCRAWWRAAAAPC